MKRLKYLNLLIQEKEKKGDKNINWCEACEYYEGQITEDDGYSQYVLCSYYKLDNSLTKYVGLMKYKYHKVSTDLISDKNIFKKCLLNREEELLKIIEKIDFKDEIYIEKEPEEILFNNINLICDNCDAIKKNFRFAKTEQEKETSFRKLEKKRLKNELSKK